MGRYDDDDDAKDVYGRCDDGNGMITAYGNVYIIPVFKTILKFLLCPYGQMSSYTLCGLLWGGTVTQI